MQVKKATGAIGNRRRATFTNAARRAQIVKQAIEVP